MIENTIARNAQLSKRINLRNCQETFANVIAEGTSCSKFEASVISNKALEIFNLGPYGDDENFLPGQMSWRAIDATEPPGKPLSSCQYRQIRLTVHSIDEDNEVLNAYGRSAKRGQQMSRMCEEAFAQGTLLTQEDLATLLDCDVRTIRNDQKHYQEKHGVLLATRGNKCDIGPGVTHREKVIEMFIRGQEALAISRQLQHSLKAVERYINSYCRIVYCQRQLRNTLKTAMVVGVSVSLVDRCLAIHQTHCLNRDYKERLQHIEEVGSAFWQAQDSKKKPGLINGRQK